MKNRENVMDYLSHGKKLTPLAGKVPIEQDWVNRIIPLEELQTHSGNFGLVINPSMCVIDMDPKNGGNESFKLLSTFLGVDLQPTVMTPSGGFHIYLTIPEQFVGKSFRKTLNKDFPGIDFLTHGSQCVIAGSKTKAGEYKWADDFLDGFIETPAPPKLFDLISYEPLNKNSDLAEYQHLIGGSSSSWPQDKVESLLDKLDPSMGNDEWVKVGMALHDWDTILGLELWERWSKGGNNYNEGQTATRWKSFGLGGGVTLGTISYMAKSVDYEAEEAALNLYIDKIKTTDKRGIDLDILPKLKKEDFSYGNLEIIAKIIKDRYHELTNTSLSISKIRQLISKSEITSGIFISENEKPRWCQDWVYVNTHNSYFDSGTLSSHKEAAFNLTNGKFVPSSSSGTKPSAAKYVADNGYINVVNSIVYMPYKKDIIITLDGKTYLNSFNHKSVPIAASEYTDKGLAAIAFIVKHIGLICGKKEYADIFTQWIAYQVQFPGQKILWCPMIQGIQGIGKSFFGQLLRACLGDENVGTVSSSQVKSDFNSWAINVAVNILEELKVNGQNRFEIANALKPLITDSVIQINSKGIKQYQAYNMTNYICFTNFRDAVPIDEDDRRWWVIFVEIDTIKELEELVGEPKEIYFSNLFSNVARYSPQIRKWFLDYKITDEFMSMKTAPKTIYKESMIATEESGTEWLDEVTALINDGGKYYDNFVISSSDLFWRVGGDIPSRVKNAILRKLGFIAYKKQIKIDGMVKRIWTKKTMTGASIRKYLKERSAKWVEPSDDFDDDL